MRLVLLGSPGAGKGTQGELLSQHYGIPRIATGDIFRAALQSGSELGNRAKAYVEKGELVPDDIVVAIVRDRLSKSDCAAGFILDGFPRTVAQAQALDETLDEMGSPLEAAVFIDVPEEVVVRRISQRRVCARCEAVVSADDKRVAGGSRCPECGGPLVQRQDDREETVRHRLAVYRENTEPVIAYYRRKSVLVSVDGDQPVDDVFAQIQERLAQRLGAGRASHRVTGTDGE